MERNAVCNRRVVHDDAIDRPRLMHFISSDIFRGQPVACLPGFTIPLCITLYPAAEWRLILQWRFTVCMSDHYNLWSNFSGKGACQLLVESVYSFLAHMTLFEDHILWMYCEGTQLFNNLLHINFSALDVMNFSDSWIHIYCICTFSLYYWLFVLDCFLSQTHYWLHVCTFLVVTYLEYLHFYY